MAYLGNDFDPEIGSVPSVIKAGEKASIPADKQLVVEGLDVQGDLDIQGTLATVTGGSLSKTTMKTESIENSVNASNPVDFVVTPTVGNSEVVDSVNNQTIAGVKTFSSSPIVPTPTIDMEAATKKYVDDEVSGIDLSSFLEDDGKSLTLNGYQRLSNGLILQWGYRSNLGNQSPKVITFPISFPNECLSIANSSNTSVASYANTTMIYNKSNNGFTITAWSTDSGIDSHWLAIGY